MNGDNPDQNPEPKENKEEVFIDESAAEPKQGALLESQSIKFIHAIETGNKELFDELVQNKSLLDYPEKNFNQTPLFFAAIVKNEDLGLEMTQKLIENGANVNHLDDMSEIAIFYAARDGRRKIIDYLASKGANPDHRDKNGQTPLYYASREGHLEAVARLIELGANVNNTDVFNQTALFYAAKTGKLEICQFLISKGINYTHQDEKKQNALYFARRSKNKQLIDYLQGLMSGAKKEKEKDKKEDKDKKEEKEKVKEKEKEVEKKPEEKKHDVKKEDNPKAKPMPVQETVVAPSEKNKKKKKEKQEPKFVYRLIYKEESGKENEVSHEEFEKFKKEYPKVAALLTNPEKINTMMEEGGKEKDSWEKIAKKVLSTLWKMKGAYIFSDPVDPKKLKIEDYFDIIKNPMDFGTIKTRLNANIYQSPEEFYNDVKLVFSNCIQYNGTTSDVGRTGVALDNEFESLVKSQGLEPYLQRARDGNLFSSDAQAGPADSKGEVKEEESRIMEEEPLREHQEMKDEKDEVEGDIKEEEIKEIKDEGESRREEDTKHDIDEEHVQEHHDDKEHQDGEENQMEEERVEQPVESANQEDQAMIPEESK